MIEGSGSIPLANGSGSRRTKNIRIRIPNIALDTVEEGNTEHLSAFNIILKILRNIFSGIFFHRRSNE
jgi:hypothetical protein